MRPFKSINHFVGAGWQKIVFNDGYNEDCSIQLSSAIDDDTEGAWERPGTSFLWVGVEDPDPTIMAQHAAMLGIETDQVTGWIPYPLPEEVLCKTRMHLTRTSAKFVVDVLTRWLEKGTLFDPERPQDE